MGRSLCVAATSGAAVVVPLLFAPGLALPFSLPKEVAFEVAASLGLVGFALQHGRAGRGDGGAPSRAAAPRTRGRELWQVLSVPSVALGPLLVLGALLLSAGLARLRTPVGVPYGLESGLRWVSLFALACGAAVVGRTPATRLGLLQAVTLSAALVSAIGLWQHLELTPLPLPIPVISAPGSTFGNRNMGGEAIAVSLPLGLAALFLARPRSERWLTVVALALECLYLAATRARGAWIGGAAGALTFLLMNRRSWSRRATAVAAAIAAISLVVAVLPARSNPRYAADTKRLASGLAVIENSFDLGAPAVRTRLGLWRRSLAMFQLAPFTGVGPGNWAVFFPAYAEPGATAEGVLSPVLAPRHAHNDLLELLAETGLLGLAAMVILGMGVVGMARRQLGGGDVSLRISIAAACASLVAIMGTGLTGFPLEMPGTLTVGGLALGLMASPCGGPAASPASPSSPSSPSSPRSQGWRRFGVAFALALLGLTIVVGTRRLWGSAWLGTAERVLHGEPGPAVAARALAALERAERADPGSFRVALRTAQVAVRLHHPERATEAAHRALAREPFSPNAWANLAGAQLSGGDVPAARASAERGLALLDDYPFALFVRAQAAEAMGEHAAAASSWAHLERLAATTTLADRDLARSASELLRAPRATLPTPAPGQ